MKNGIQRAWFYFLWLMISGVQAQTIDYATVFPTVVQGHTKDLAGGCSSGNKSTLTITNNSEITGGSSPSLNVCGLTQDNNNKNCVSDSGKYSKCTANGTQIETMTLDAFSSSTSTTSKTFQNNSNGQLGETGTTEFGDVTVENSTVTFSANNTTYKLKSLTMRNGSPVIYFAPGDY